MKALKIYETLNFERNKDPKESMGIGSEEFRMVNEVDKDLKPLGLVKTGLADMGSQSNYMRSLEEWKKPDNPKTRVNLYFMNWYGIEKYQFSITVNDYPCHFGNESTNWYDFERRWDKWTNSLEIIKITNLKSGSVLKAKEKYAISSKLHLFRFHKDTRKKDYIIEKDEEIKITDIDFGPIQIWGGIKVSYNDTYFISNAEDIWRRFDIINL